MGRRKLKIEKIQDRPRRKITFSKRKNGLLKKAGELSLLCDVDVAVIVFSPLGMVTEFCKDDRIEEVLARYAKEKKTKKSKISCENESVETARTTHLNKREGESDTCDV